MNRWLSISDMSSRFSFPIRLFDFDVFSEDFFDDDETFPFSFSFSLVFPVFFLLLVSLLFFFST